MPRQDVYKRQGEEITPDKLTYDKATGALQVEYRVQGGSSAGTYLSLIHILLVVNNEEGGLFMDERNVISYTAPVPLPNGDKLALGATYEVSVAAVSAVGEGEQTSTMYIIIQGQAAESVPGRPGKPVITAGNRQLTVNWSEPVIEGTVEGIEGYYVYYREKTQEREAEPVEIWHSDTAKLTEVITGLTNDTDYEVWVVARNRIGTSAVSAIATGRPEEISAPPRPMHILFLIHIW